MSARNATQIISANRLSDGLVVYFTTEGAWVVAIGEATIFTDAEAAKSALELARGDVKKNLIVDPFLVEVTTATQSVAAVKLRDTIRAKGPTIDYAAHS
ncbi:DUF2849 domain-containing protein [Beijerinckia mobilis]|uniref:DUF2849 domain-containing protein n=1 Tax=Beijerinckia mobilis TaxID=231434 RepID=UPI00054E10FF|nr:DUF2849 domain-containing protein [Beijerinckia mobilis]